MDAKIAVISEDEFHEMFNPQEKISILASVSKALKEKEICLGYWVLVTDVYPDQIPVEFDGLDNFALAIPAVYTDDWKFGGCYLFSQDEIDCDEAMEFCKTLFQKRLDMANKINLN